MLATPQRGPTVRDIMKLQWDFPVYVPKASKYAQERHALPRDEALAYIAGDDPRPMIVVRECGWCKGSDDALLSTRLDNEKTVLMSHWFHMVKLPNDVLSDDHPFRNLFEGDAPPHLFVTSRNGSMKVPLSGQQSQTELWDALEQVLDATYARDADQAIECIYKLLDKFDQLDQADSLLASKLSDEIEKHGPKSSKIKKIKKDMQANADERKEIQDELDKARDLTG